MLKDSFKLMFDRHTFGTIDCLCRDCYERQKERVLENVVCRFANSCLNLVLFPVFQMIMKCIHRSALFGVAFSLGRCWIYLLYAKFIPDKTPEFNGLITVPKEVATSFQNRLIAQYAVDGPSSVFFVFCQCLQRW